MRARTLFSLFGVLALCVGVAGAQDVLINEVDADTEGTDVLEFVELYGTPNLPLDGMVLVFINGSDDLCYADGIDLDAELGALERQLIAAALERTAGVKKTAAELLGLSFRSLRYRIEKLAVGEPEEDRD